ncbi:MAG: SH3 domain-containing protein [Chloroflexi bacterium]|nr:SH3 domain-containing protein [Chloroflexota bacterium]
MKDPALTIQRLGTAVLLVAVLLASAGCAAKPAPTPTPTKTPRPTLTPTVAKPTRTPTPLVPSATPTPLTPPTATPAPPIGIKYVCADGDGVYVRSRPDLEARVEAWPDGTEMMVLAQEGDWSKVRAPDGYVGYVPTQYLCLVQAALPTTAPAPPPPPPQPTATPNPANTFEITLFAACPQDDQAEIVANIVDRSGERISGLVVVLTNDAGGQYVSDPSLKETQWVQYPCAAVPAQFERKLYNVKLSLTQFLRGQKGDWFAYVAQSKENLAPLSKRSMPISFANGGRYFIDFQRQ